MVSTAYRIGFAAKYLYMENELIFEQFLNFTKHFILHVTFKYFKNFTLVINKMRNLKTVAYMAIEISSLKTYNG